MAKRSPGLCKRGNVWHIDKRVRGKTIRESTGTSDLREAEELLARRVADVSRQARFGDCPTIPFADAAERYLQENQHLRSIDTIESALRRIRPYLDPLELSAISDESLDEFRACYSHLAAASINKTLAHVRRILNLASRKWRDGQTTWLATAPMLEPARGIARKPYPLSWDEQRRLMGELPPHLELIALFAVNTGCRAGEITALRWEWEVKVPELDTSVFILPEEFTKNGQERVVCLNSIALRVIGSGRGVSGSVFTYKGRAIQKLSASGWRKARVRASLPGVRFHDLRHTFGHRLRAAGVSLEDRADLLGHKSGRMTTHYSAPELGRLIAAAESIVDAKPTTVLRIAR